MKGSDLPRSVQILAHVLPNPDSAYPVAFDPYKLDISQFGEKKRTEIEFDIINRSPEKLKLEIVAYNDNYISVEVPDEIDANATVKGKVRVKPDKVDESFDKSVTFAVTGPNDKKPIRFTLPVKRAVRKFSSKLNAAMKAPKSKSSKGSGGK